MYTRKRDVRVVGIFFLLFLIYSLQGWAQVKGLTITPTNQAQSITEGVDYTYENDLLTVNTSIPVTISGQGQVTTDRIVVPTNTTAIITIKDINIELTDVSPFQILGNASVTLILEEDNKLRVSEFNTVALLCERKDGKVASLKIEGTGRLTVEAISYQSVGIGSSGNPSGDITIEGGEVIAHGGYYAPAIGGTEGGNITISGGVVTAYGNEVNTGTGIGCANGNDNTGYKIIISGGIITTTGQCRGIGAGKYEIIINGGVITDSGGIGNDLNKRGATFSTTLNGQPGTAFINTPDIKSETSTDLSGIIFTGDNGKVYGNQTWPKDMAIPSGKNLEIENGHTLTIAEGNSLLVEGTMTNNGSVVNNGTIGVKGTLTNKKDFTGGKKTYKLDGGTITGITPECKDGILITFKENAGSDKVTNMLQLLIMEKNATFWEPLEKPQRAGYAFIGWGETEDSKTAIDKEQLISGDKTLYAVWKRNSIITFTNKNAAGNYSSAYGSSLADPVATVADELTGGNLSESIIYAYFTDAMCTNKTTADNSGATNEGERPVYAGNYYIKATYPGNEDNVSVSISTVYAITPVNLTVTPTANQSIYKDEIPDYSVSGTVGLEKAAFSGALGVNTESPKKVTKGDLTLIDNNESGFKAANYTWELSSADVEITVLDKTLKEALIEASSLTTDWYKEKVVLIAPAGFRIAAVSPLRSIILDWKDRIEIEKEGSYDFECQLKRTVGTMPAQTVSIPIKLDNTDPVVSIAINHLIVTVTLSDDLSGLASCTYVWNNGGDKTEPLTTGNKTHSFTLTAPSAGSYPLKVVLTDQAGNETTYNETVTLTNPTTPVDPPVGPSEPSETYTVTLPAVEGAATDPTAGNYEVTSWSDFGFLLTLDAAYNQSVPIVTTDRGETIEPRVSDGKYIIKRVRSNVSVSISGIVKNPDPVANEEVSSPALRIYTVEGILCLDVPTVTEAWLITVDGRLLRSLTLSPGLNRVYGLREGVYIVRLKDGTTRKVLIGK